MKIRVSSWLLGLLAVGIMISASSGSANAGPRAACGVLSLAEIRGLARSPVSVAQSGSFSPKTKGNATSSICTYSVMDASGHPTGGGTARITLIWAPSATLAQTSQFYTQKHLQSTGVKGGVLVLAVITHAEGEPDWSASKKLVAAVLQKL